MKRISLILALLAIALLVFSSAVLSQEKAKTEQKAFKYMGIQKCKLCHSSAPKGKVYDWWTNNKHSKAYTTLANDESKKIANQMGIADAQKSEKCLTCHVTGYKTPADQKGIKYVAEEGVTCEACHGPSEAYVTTHTKDPKSAIKEQGLVMPTKEVCLACHNKNSPTYEELKFPDAFKQIKHGPSAATPVK